MMINNNNLDEPRSSYNTLLSDLLTLQPVWPCVATVISESSPLRKRTLRASTPEKETEEDERSSSVKPREGTQVSADSSEGEQD